MTIIYFIRHAESNHNNHNDVTRELTARGLEDRKLVSQYLKDKNVDAVLSSPYQRSVDTLKHFADLNNHQIERIDDFRERRADGEWIEDFDAFCHKLWNDFSYKLSDGETLSEVQERNVSALKIVLKRYKNQTIVIGSHGIALSTIIHYYDSDFGYEEFMKIKSLMPWIVKFEFENEELICIEKINVFDME